MELVRAALAPRYLVYVLSLVATVAFLVLSVWSAMFLVPLAIAAALATIGTRDVLQTRHSVLRNYPISAHLRFLLEGIRPEIRELARSRRPSPQGIPSSSNPPPRRRSAPSRWRSVPRRSTFPKGSSSC